MNETTIESLKAIDDAAAKLIREIRVYLAGKTDPSSQALRDLAADQITVIRVSAATVKKQGD